MSSLSVLQATVRYPPAVGGVETCAALLSESLAHRGHDVAVHTSGLGWPHDSAAPATASEGPVVHVHATWTPPGLPSYPILRGLRRAIARSGADVVHGHGYHLCSADVPALRRLRAPTPFVLNPYFHPATTPKWRIYQRTLGRLSIRADATVVLSAFEQRMIERAGLPVRRFERISPAVDPTRLAGPVDPAVLRRWGVDPARHRVILSVGRLAAHKGLSVILAAVAELVPAQPDIRLLLVGPDAGARRNVEAAARERGLEKHVVLTGAAGPGELATAYRSAEAFMFASAYETFGLVLLEAMAAGLPIVALDRTVVSEVVEHGTTGVLASDAKGLGRALGEMLGGDALRAAMGEAGRRRVLERHDPSDQATAVESLYRSLLDP